MPESASAPTAATRFSSLALRRTHLMHEPNDASSSMSGGATLPSRRTVLRGTAAVAAVGAATTVDARAAFPRQTVDAEAWLLNRGSFGATEEGLIDVRARGLRGWVDWQLDPGSIDDSDLDQRLLEFDYLSWTPFELSFHPTLPPTFMALEFRGVRMLRSVYSRRQLFERVVEFWTNHFNIYGATEDTNVLKLVDDRDVIRANALGTFRELLHASAKSPAMLAYLDNDTNVAGAPQENYARELMELHTLGADGPFSETDVRELARCLTGWTYWTSYASGPQYGTFRFNDQTHDWDAKNVLGLSIPAGGGLSDAEQVLDLLADHPKTIDFVTTKLTKWFLGEEPPQSVIDGAKDVWVQTGGSIKAIVRYLLSPGALRASAPWHNVKLKPPFHWAVSMFRATGVDIDNPLITTLQLLQLGNQPFNWAPPNGYPDTAVAWAPSLLLRWREGTRYTANGFSTLPIPVADLRQLLVLSPMAEWAERLSDILCGGTMSAFDKSAIQRYIDSFPSANNQAVIEAFDLAVASPSFQTF